MGPRVRLSGGVLVAIFLVVIGIQAGSMYNTNAVVSAWSAAGVLVGTMSHDKIESAYRTALMLYQSADSFASPLMGFMLDNFGPRVTSATGSIMQITGVAFAIGARNHWMLFISTLIQGSAIQMILNSSLSIGNICIPYESVAVAILSGGADLSTAVYLVIHALGSDLYYTALVGHILLCGICCLVSLTLLPPTSFTYSSIQEKSEEEEEEREEREESETDAMGTLMPASRVTDDHRLYSQTYPLTDPTVSHTNMTATSVILTLGHHPRVDAAEETLFSQLFSFQFAVAFSFFCFGIFRQNFYLNHNRLLLDSKGDLDGWYASVLATMQPAGILFAITIGYLADTTGVYITTLLVNTAAVGVYGLSLLPFLKIQILTFILFMGQKCCIYTLLFVSLAQNFGHRHFGKLTSICSVGVGCLNLLQIYLDSYINEDPQTVLFVTKWIFVWSILFFGVLVLTKFFPRRGVTGGVPRGLEVVPEELSSSTDESSVVIGRKVLTEAEYGKDRRRKLSRERSEVESDER